MFSLSDSDIGLYLQGVNCDKRFNCEIDEIDVSPVQIRPNQSINERFSGDTVDLIICHFMV